MNAKEMLTEGQLPRAAFPIFARALIEDGIFWRSDYGGIQFYFITKAGHHYKVTNALIIKNWKLNQSSWRRFVVWLSINRPHVSDGEYE